jgi:hypothetical protein
MAEMAAQCPHNPRPDKLLTKPTAVEELPANSLAGEKKAIA